MQRLKQIFQNSFIRIIAVFSVLFRSISGFFRSIFGGLGKSLGFSDSNSGYYVDSDNKKAIEENQISLKTVKTPEPVVSGDRRRPKKSNMDDFIQMAKELKKG